MNTFRRARLPIRERLTLSLLLSCQVEQNELRGALTVTKKQEDKAGADIPGLNDERQACYEIIKAKRDEIRSLRDEHKKKEDEHFNRERLWRAFLKLEQQKKWEAGLDERKAREAAKKAWDIENAPEPFELEVAVRACVWLCACARARVVACVCTCVRVVVCMCACASGGWLPVPRKQPGA